MSTYRIYPSKANTIASGPFVLYNSSQNAVTDLFYGGGVQTDLLLRNSISRHLMFFDLTELQRKFDSKEIMSGNVTSYRLKMTNAVPSERMLEKNWEFDKLQRQIAASFDLVAWPINMGWDEGRGYDLVQEDYLVKQKGNLQITGYSNWNSASSLSAWTQAGVYTNPTASTSATYATQHFAIGNEDINMDVTNMVTDWLTGGTTNNGIGVSYARPFEETSANTRYISAFFTHKTNTAFKPYLEVTYNQTVNDDRMQVTNNRQSRLFLYTFSANTPTNYFSAGSVTIKNSAGATVHTLTPTQLEKGVYYVDVFMSGATYGERYSDNWEGVTFTPGYDQQTITQYFSIQDNFYTGTMFKPAINDYVLDLYGLPEGGNVYIGQEIRVYASLRAAYSTQPPKNNYKVRYRLYLNNEKEIIPWTELNQAVVNKEKHDYLTLDTSWLLHNQTYQLQFQIEEWGTTRMYPKNYTFKVLRPF